MKNNKKTILFLFLLNLILLNCLIAQEDFFIKPYLLDVTTNSATIGFHLNESLSAKVLVYIKDNVLEFGSPEKKKSHFVRITGLETGKIYDYEVICEDEIIKTRDKEYQIRTAVREGEYFKFSIFGDPRPGENKTHQIHREIIEQLILQEPSFNLVLGDMVDDGREKEQWRSFFQIESELMKKSPIYAVLGDNDFSQGKGVFADYFPKLKKGYYTFEWGGVQFLGLNAWDTRGIQKRKDLDSNSEQIKWLEVELSKKEVQNSLFRVVFIHDPVFISRGRSAEILKQIWVPIFYKYNVDIVFASWHLYERSQNEGITYIISGGAGAEIIWMNKDPDYESLIDAQQHHYCLVEINSNAMNIKAIALDGTILDDFTIFPKNSEIKDDKFVQRNFKKNSTQILINNKNDLPEIPLYLFSYDCSYCRKLINKILPETASKFNIAFKVQYFDLAEEGSYELLLNAGEQFGRQGTDIPTIFMGNKAFGGDNDIYEILPKELSLFKKNPEYYLFKAIEPFNNEHDTENIKEESFLSLALGLVIGAGFLDGINPCAFSTIIFLISYLSLVGGTRKQIFKTGIVFSLAVFLSYFLIGLTFFSFAKIIMRNSFFSNFVNYLLLVFVTVLAVLSFIDYIRIRKGRTKDVTLQLSASIKDKIRAKIRKFARKEKAILGTTFILGVIIAGMELTCTGQVYIPIVTMISEPEHRISAVLYLFIYNLAFIIPLIIIFLLTVFGVTSQRMSVFFRKNLASVKLGLVFLFILMAILIIYNLGWI